MIKEKIIEDAIVIPKDLWLDKSDYSHDGLLVVVCGFDGSGKTTQVSKLASYFRGEGKEVLVEKQPTDEYRKDPRVRYFLENGGNAADAKVLSLLAAADRLYHIHSVVLPALELGKVVLCDRYIYSSFALFKHRGIPASFLSEINSGIPVPDYAFYLDVPVRMLLDRIEERGNGEVKFEESRVEYVESICNNFISMEGDLLVIDGTRSENTVFNDLVEYLIIGDKQ